MAVITLSLGFNGAAAMTNLQNSQDLAPNFAGSLYGIINFVGTTSGFISPIIVAHFTQNEVINIFLAEIIAKMSLRIPEHNKRVAIRFLDWSGCIYHSSSCLCLLR